ncbi:MAG: GNAT family N-acetyltransferase [Bacteroidetes bacterium]|nr:GNAT family N-acetyltransferase [Bacteroidota bacterium]
MNDFNFRPIRQRDSRAFFDLVQANAPHLERYFPITLDACKSRISAARHLRLKIRQRNQREGWAFLLDYIPESRPVGYFVIKNLDWNVPKAELAYFVDKPFNSKGLGTYGVGEMIHFSFTELNLHKLYLYADEKNLGSCRIAEKNNFKLEGRLRDDFRTGQGDLITSNYYGLLREDWEIAKMHA